MPPTPRPFGSIYAHGYVRAAVCVPRVRVADPAFNLAETLALARRAGERQAVVALFPELGLTAYTCDDLFHQDALLDAAEDALAELAAASRDLLPLLVVGVPVRAEGKLFNCAAVVHRGRILGVVPKSYLPNYREFYEKRYFASARRASVSEVNSSSSLRSDRRVKRRPKFDLTISSRWVATTSVGVTTDRPISAASSWRAGAIQRAGAP